MVLVTCPASKSQNANLHETGCTGFRAPGEMGWEGFPGVRRLRPAAWEAVTRGEAGSYSPDRSQLSTKDSLSQN